MQPSPSLQIVEPPPQQAKNNLKFHALEIEHTPTFPSSPNATILKESLQSCHFLPELNIQSNSHVTTDRPHVTGAIYTGFFPIPSSYQEFFLTHDSHCKNPVLCTERTSRTCIPVTDSRPTMRETSAGSSIVDGWVQGRKERQRVRSPTCMSSTQEKVLIERPFSI